MRNKALVIFILSIILVFAIGLKLNSKRASTQNPYSTSTPETVETDRVATSTSTQKNTVNGATEKTVEKPKVSVQSPAPTTQTPSPIVSLPIQPALAIQSTPDFEQINDTARKSVVNILCETKTGGTIHPITGTGVIIDSRGIILTNAHIAEYFLIKDLYMKDFVQCTIRTGSPAYPRYNVELVYISPTWVKNNTTLLKSTDPKGTGENDYAFLRITSSIDGSPLPTFPHLTIKTSENFELGENVNLVAYPAGFLGGQSIQQDLSLTSALTTIQDIFTFKDSTIDLVSVPGTILSQKGASGGAVVNKDTSLIGIITTSSDAPTTDKRELRAITTPYINRALKAEAGMSLQEFLLQDMIIFAQNFQQNIAPSLTKLIQDELSK